jgi:hypothetical protein
MSRTSGSRSLQAGVADAAQHPPMTASAKGARAMRSPRRPPVRRGIRIAPVEPAERHHQGIVTDERGQEQPADKKRALDNK